MLTLNMPALRRFGNVKLKSGELEGHGFESIHLMQYSWQTFNSNVKEFANAVNYNECRTYKFQLHSENKLVSFRNIIMEPEKAKKNCLVRRTFNFFY